MAKVTLEVCDVCHDRSREVQVWRVAAPGGRLRRVVLCEEHAAPLAELPGVEGRRRGQRVVVSRDEVEGTKG